MCLETALENPLIVEVRGRSGNPLPGAAVTFSITGGGGALSATRVTTNSNGRAQSTLTLGQNPGTNSVTVSVAGTQEGWTFSAEGIRTAKKLVIMSGNNQQGPPGAALTKPFVVEVRDQSDKPLPGVQVTFAVSSGDGTLSATGVMTNSDGRAQSRLTLGPNTGTNTVTVSVAGDPGKADVQRRGDPDSQETCYNLWRWPTRNAGGGTRQTVCRGGAGSVG